MHAEESQLREEQVDVLVLELLEMLVDAADGLDRRRDEVHCKNDGENRNRRPIHPEHDERLRNAAHGAFGQGPRLRFQSLNECIVSSLRASADLDDYVVRLGRVTQRFFDVFA